MLKRLAVELLSLYLRRVSWEKGRWRLALLGLGWAREALPPDARRTVRTRDGFRMELGLGDWLGRHVYVTGEYEPSTAEVIKALLRPGDTFVDVGANAGYFTLLASASVGAEGKVFAFEPVPEVRAELVHNLELNRTANVVVRAEAAADHEGEATFFVGPANHRGTSSLRSLSECSDILKVRQGRLDALLPQGQTINLVKMDVEGAEYLALRGMRECLQRARPDLVVEVTDSYLRPLGHSAEMLCRFLLEFGYRMYAIDHNGLTPVVNPAGPFPGQFNALFTARPDLPRGLRINEQAGSVGTRSEVVVTAGGVEGVRAHDLTVQGVEVGKS